MNKHLSIIIAVLLLFSCSSEKPGGSGISEKGKDDTEIVQQARPAESFSALELAPKDATRNSTLQLVSRGFDLSDAKLEWSINGVPFTTVKRTQFDGAEAAKGDAIQAKASVKDRVVLSNIVKIMNASPEIVSVNILPETFKPGDTLGIEAVGSDIDGDKVTFLYEWTKNEKPAGKGERIEGTLKRGDKFSVTVTPSDGEAFGRNVVLNREIGNLPPMIVDHNEFTFDEKVYSYQVKATDPDGDTLTYSLNSSPDGMTIDPFTGLLKWVVPKEFNGKKDVSIAVSDGHGGTAKYIIAITIQ